MARPDHESSPLLADSRIDPEVTLEHAVYDVYEAFAPASPGHEPHDEDAIWLREQLSLNKSIHWLRRPLLVAICFIVFAWAFSFSSAEPTRQMITYKLACNSLAANDPFSRCDPTETQLLMSNLHIAYLFLGGIVTLIVLGKIGPLLDQYGRKLFICLIFAFVIASKALKYWIMTHYPTLQVGMMIAAEILGNLCGGLMAVVTLTNCYISDICQPNERIYYLGISIASLFIGLSVGPLAGNLIASISSGLDLDLALALVLALSLFQVISPISSFSSLALILSLLLAVPSAQAFEKVNPTLLISSQEFRPLRFELAVFLLVGVYAFIGLPESRSYRSRQKSRSMLVSLTQLAPLSETSVTQPAASPYEFLNFLKPLALLTLPLEIMSPAARPFRTQYRITIAALVFIDCMYSMTGMSLGEIFVLYGLHRFGWDKTDIAHFIAISCACKALVLIVVSPAINYKLLQSRLKLPVFRRQFDPVDSTMCLVGLACDCLGLVLMFLAPSSRWFLAAPIVTSFGSLISPAATLSLTKFYPESKVGELYGAVALVKNGFTLVCPVLFLSLYKVALTHGDRPGIVFLVVAGLMFSGIMAISYVSRILCLGRRANPLPLTAASLSSNS